MSLKDDIENILFEIGKEIKFHYVYDGNFVIEIDYKKHSGEILNKIKEHYPEIKIQDEID